MKVEIKARVSRRSFRQRCGAGTTHFPGACMPSSAVAGAGLLLADDAAPRGSFRPAVFAASPTESVMLLVTWGREKQTAVRCQPCDTITALRTRLQELLGLPADQQRLLVEGRLLDHGTVRDYIPHHDDRPLHVRVEVASLSIFVQIATGRITRLEIAPASFTVGHLKAMLAHELALPDPEMRLVCQGRALTDENSKLYEYDLEQDCVLEVLPLDPIKLKLTSPRLRCQPPMLTMRVCLARDTMLDVESLLEWWFGVALFVGEPCYIFRGARLARTSTRTLAELGLSRDAQIWVTPCDMALLEVD